MIYFYENLVTQTVDIVKSAYDCADILTDLNRIEQAKERVRVSGDWYTANQLDEELRQKYPYIDVMNKVADSFAVPSLQPAMQYSIYDAVIESLTNDRYGILCGTAIKKGLIHNPKEFIKSVD